MEGPPPVKGTVMPLSSLFPAEEAQKAAQRVHDAIAEKQQELDRLTGFITDNASHINLVQKLPHELHHHIMVPLGKAAFFPGRTIHTNELMVFEGENYYADRTVKQTIDILKRRGKALQSQVDSLKANMQDLKAEASFFSTTASEAMEGLVEIREDYVEENSTQRIKKSGQLKQDFDIVSEMDNKKVAAEDDEYARMMARLDELENEELAAGSEDDDNEDEHDEDEEVDATESDDEDDEDEADATKSDNEDDEGEEADETGIDNERNKDEQNKAGFHQNEGQLRKLSQQTKHETKVTEESNKYNHQDLADQFNCTGLTAEPRLKGEIPRGSRSLIHDVTKFNPAEKSALLPEMKGKIRAMPSSGNTFSGQSSKPSFDGSKAFTGSIVEHPHNLPPTSQTSTSAQSLGAQPSKPVSRFKMQRK